MRKINLQQRLRHWQKTLRLQDWELSASWTPELACSTDNDSYYGGDPEDFQIMAGINTDPITKKGEIFLRTTGWDAVEEQEKALVHELLHVVLLEMQEAKGSRARLIALERTINQLVRVLCG